MKHFHGARISPINYHSYYREHISKPKKCNLFMTYCTTEVKWVRCFILYILYSRTTTSGHDMYAQTNQEDLLLSMYTLYTSYTSLSKCTYSIRDQSCDHLLTDSEI